MPGNSFFLGTECRHLGIPWSSVDASQSTVFYTDWRWCKKCISTKVALPPVTDQQAGTDKFLYLRQIIGHCYCV